MRVLRCTLQILLGLHYRCAMTCVCPQFGTVRSLVPRTILRHVLLTIFNYFAFSMVHHKFGGWVAGAKQKKHIPNECYPAKGSPLLFIVIAKFFFQLLQTFHIAAQSERQFPGTVLRCGHFACKLAVEKSITPPSTGPHRSRSSPAIDLLRAPVSSSAAVGPRRCRSRTRASC